MWSIIGKFIKQDLTKISLPLILCEPLNILQRCGEMMEDFKILENMMKTNDNESALRLAMCAVFEIAQFGRNKHRFKKPFNPILGETYEFVTNNSRFIAEQVSHHPPVTAFLL